MRDRSRATLGPIVQGLLIAGLCTLAAAAQQTATPASPGAATLAQAPNTAVGPKGDATEGQAPADQTQDASGATKDTGVSNPDAVTPAASSPAANQAANGPAADSKPEQKSPQTGDAGTTPQPAMIPATAVTPAVSGQAVTPSDFPTPAAGDPVTTPDAGKERFAPDQPPQPLTPDHDSDKPTPAEPSAQSAPAGSIRSPPVPMLIANHLRIVAARRQPFHRQKTAPYREHRCVRYLDVLSPNGLSELLRGRALSGDDPCVTPRPNQPLRR